MNSWSSKKPSLVTARVCVLIIQAFQLSSSVQFYDRSRLPYPCRPESHKRNTCELASASCSLCRSTLPCRQVRRVTNIYVLSFYLSSLSSFRIRSSSSISILLAEELPDRCPDCGAQTYNEKPAVRLASKMEIEELLRIRKEDKEDR